ncbi:MAG: DUF3135 domain-containing protein [Thermodesulfobacteriota bacterium]
MEKWNSLAEKQKREAAALKEHERLHRLFREDRLSFERERKRAIDSLINSVKDEAQRRSLREFQESWDRKMRGAGSKHNRFVLAQTFFWEHFNEVFLPAMRAFGADSSRRD